MKEAYYVEAKFKLNFLTECFENCFAKHSNNPHHGYRN